LADISVATSKNAAAAVRAGCVQIALDPEAISVAPAVYFPEVLEMARQLINTSVRRLEYEEIRRLLHSSTGCAN
jgi:hypothetical protein